MNSFFGEEGFLANPFFLEDVVNKENFSLDAGKNYFTVIAPTFGEANDMTLYTIAFLMYMDELAKATKRESGRDSKSIILDVVYSYGSIHNWPEEILGAESAVKMGIVKDITRLLQFSEQKIRGLNSQGSLVNNHEVNPLDACGVLREYKTSAF